MQVNGECSLPNGLVVRGKSFLYTKTNMVIRSFIKCGISVPPDGSRDDKINLNGLEDYTVDSEDEGNPFSDEDDVEDPAQD